MSFGERTAVRHPSRGITSLEVLCWIFLRVSRSSGNNQSGSFRLGFGIDGLAGGRCGGPMRIVAVVKNADAIAAELHGARPPQKPSRPGQLELFDGLG